MVQAFTLTQSISCQFYEVAKVGIIGRFRHIWLQAKYESKIFKNPSIILATYLNHVYKFGIFFLNFGQIMAIENLERHLILALLISNLAIWLFMASGKQGCSKMIPTMGEHK